MKRKAKDTFDTLFKSYSRGMYNICLRMIGNKQDAEDTLQDAFYLAYLNFGTLKSADSFGAWIKKIVINQCLKFLRSRIHFSDIDFAKNEIEDEETIDLQKCTMQQINAGIQKLPDGCRIVFNLYLLENFTHKQIAEKLGVSESTSKSQYQRARSLLQKRLKY